MLAQSPALNTDFYELTMAAAYYAHGMNGPATFSLFAHGLPKNRSFMVSAGLERILKYLEDFRFSQEDIDYLHSLGRFKPDFLDFLSKIRFSGDVWAMSEGSICFGGEPLLEITAPIIEGQLIETYLINVLNLNTMLASKAARCVIAAQGITLVDFSLRRTQGLEGGFAAARSSALVGFQGTSNVAAAADLGIAPVGTMAHSFVEAFGEESAAFQAFIDSFPDQTVILVDTYDSLSGLKKSIEAALEMRKNGHEVLGVRLDSGDLVVWSKKARAMLDEAGFPRAQVVVSGSLDEYRIADLIRAGAAVDMYAVGTKMGSSADAPYIDLAYKLVSYEGRPTLKLSTGKETWAAAKQIWRCLDDSGRVHQDVLGLRDQQMQGEPLLKKVMQGGKPLGPAPDWRAAQKVFQRDLARMPEQCLGLGTTCHVRVIASNELQELQKKARVQVLSKRRS